MPRCNVLELILIGSVIRTQCCVWQAHRTARERLDEIDVALFPIQKSFYLKEVNVPAKFDRQLSPGLTRSIPGYYSIQRGVHLAQRNKCYRQLWLAHAAIGASVTTPSSPAFSQNRPTGFTPLKNSFAKVSFTIAARGNTS